MEEAIRKAMMKMWSLTEDQLDKALSEGRIYPTAMHQEYEETSDVTVEVSEVPMTFKEN